MKKKWTKEIIGQEALKYKTRGAFHDHSKGAYLAALRSGILNQVCSHMPIRVDISGENSYNYKWTPEMIQEESLKYKTRKEFENGSENAYQAATKRGILNQICAHMGEKANEPWTNEELILEAKKYNTRGNFRLHNRNAYDAVVKRGIIGDICSHMPARKDVSGENSHNYKWTLEMLKEEALKYKTRGEFAKKNTGAYGVAWRRGILDKICYHMKLSGNASIAEIELINILKQRYPNIKTLKCRKINIPEHPWIYGFDIDGYIEDIKKGIEFDGTWHHSVEGLKRSHPTWPDRDIKNYHKIKDKYFTTMGIEIIHIKEKDWKKNKQLCIKKCFNFLKIM